MTFSSISVILTILKYHIRLGAYENKLKREVR